LTAASREAIAAALPKRRGDSMATNKLSTEKIHGAGIAADGPRSVAGARSAPGRLSPDPTIRMSNDA
jgi:hypothetical protein